MAPEQEPAPTAPTSSCASQSAPVAAPVPAHPVAAPAPVHPVAAPAPVPPVAASVPAPPVAASASVPALPVAASVPALPVAASVSAPPVATSILTSEKQSKKIGRFTSQHNYDKLKRKRSGDEGMLCTVCIAHPTHADRMSSLVKGCASYRREILTSHQSSISHRRRMAVNQRVRQEQDAEPVQGPMDHQLRNMNAKEVDTMVILFNTAYFIVKEESPFITYPKLVSLQLRNGQYQNDNACRRFTKYLYNDVMSTTFNEITNCSMMDHV